MWAKMVVSGDDDNVDVGVGDGDGDIEDNGDDIQKIIRQIYDELPSR